uniref:polysaccharide deacetylase family protein n=1 Tax=Roseovarius indicus TaxID=540747 RepID=UPI003B53003C
MRVKRFAFHYELLETPENARGVFSDPRKVRKKKLRRRLFVFSFCIVGWLALFLQSAGPSASVATGRSSLFPAKVASLEPFSAAVQRSEELHANFAFSENCVHEEPAFAAMANGKNSNRVFAHVPVSIDWSHLSLGKSCDKIDVLLTDWLTIVESNDGLALDVANKDTRAPIEAYLAGKRRAPEVMPRIQLDLKLLDSSFLEKSSSPSIQESLLHDLRKALNELGASGACVDYGQFAEEGWDKSKDFIRLVRSELQDLGLRTCMIVEGEDRTWIADQVADGFDDVILKIFIDPWVGSPPTPLSGDQWRTETLRLALQEVGRERLVVAIGNFSVDWISSVPVPRKLAYGQSMSAIAEAEAGLSFNSEASGSFASFRDAEGQLHKLWMLDAASAYNQLFDLRVLGISRIAIWSLGLEDPGLWPLINAENMSTAIGSTQIGNVLIDNYLEYTGSGAAIKVSKQLRHGFRTFELDADTGRIKNQEYSEYPRPYALERYGATAPNKLVLTFDDGPNAEFTPRVLDILKEKQVPAAFFVLGKNVMSAPEVLKRVFEEGHEVGAHSFSHPRMDKISSSRTALEHDMTHRVIASTIGHDTALYREPFLRSGGPISSKRVSPLAVVQSRGDIIFGMDIVPKDWLGLNGKEIADYVIDQVEKGRGNVILLHDGGGDRTASIEALPKIIDDLRARGYEFISVAEALRIDRESLMPPVDGVRPVFDHVSFSFLSNTTGGIVLVFWFVLIVGVVRSILLLVLAALRKRHTVAATGPFPKVSVVIPAFNEEAAISKCIHSVLASDYPFLEIVVVDDGSTDLTLNRIFEFKHKKNVRVISQPNQGKWSALNRAILTLDADVAVCIDADTQIRRDAISQLAMHFFDPTVGAVAGKILVGNRVNLLTRVQALEYVSAQNFDRRAFDYINGILVVPGAIGAWRVSSLHEAGLYCHDTMTEDSDLTISVNRAGYRVVYEDRAIAHTEAPQTVRSLLAQRLRWSLGMFQSAWKHKRAMFEGRGIGLIALPDMFVFGYLFPLFAPVADLFAATLLFDLIAGDWSGDVGSASQSLPTELLWAFLTLPALEFLIASISVFSDKSAKKSLLLLWPIQRLFYRPLLYLTVYRAVFRAMSGTLANWGGSKRQGHDLMSEYPNT